MPDLLAGFLTTNQAACALRLSPVTLTKWRAVDKGPSWCRIAGRVLYREDDLRDWIENEAKRSTAA
ncbi:helix-turn-helix domain-containing protein [Fulvimarina sp. 2208YS6-2-32]|uniref:Helix-turn-helix domain-containing protein n=1 Tax=Fulvimarina uroteuthidis TaxID=3098149 RepID=A0ABU5I7I3_9HYPH|nr:helix-turn-helix domain-containing protein [Fulvimarina sp. 2208YS6-2-32]MDY8111130.1 helix-turn-helix domain-containing protein [Fulvimarina sp. 2208YS6-2-32]